MFQGSWAFTFGSVWFCAALFDRLGHTFGHTLPESAKGGGYPPPKWDSGCGDRCKCMFAGEPEFSEIFYFLKFFDPYTPLRWVVAYVVPMPNPSSNGLWEKDRDDILYFGAFHERRIFGRLFHYGGWRISVFPEQTFTHSPLVGKVCSWGFEMVKNLMHILDFLKFSGWRIIGRNLHPAAPKNNGDSGINHFLG